MSPLAVALTIIGLLIVVLGLVLGIFIFQDKFYRDAPYDP